MTPTHATKGGKRYRYYVCSRSLRQGRDHCPSQSVPAGPMEQIVVEQVSKLGQDPKRLQSILKEASNQRRTRLADLEGDCGGLEQELARAQARIQNLLQEVRPKDRKQQSASDVEVIRENIGHLERRLAETKKQALALQQPLGVEHAARALEVLEQEFDSRPVAEQTRLIRLIVQSIEYDGGRGKLALTLDPAGLAAVVGELTQPKEETAS